MKKGPARGRLHHPVGHFSGPIRSMAAEIGLAHPTNRRIRNAFVLPQHRAEPFKRSTDPLSLDMVRDVLALDTLPPNRALVMWIKTPGAGAVARTARVAARRTHTDTRNDFAVCRPRHHSRRGDRNMLQAPPRAWFPAERQP